MKNLKRLKLSSLSQSLLEDREMGSLQGGTYCAWGEHNSNANAAAGYCSCSCSGDYYGSTGLNHQASYFKVSTSW